MVLYINICWQRAQIKTPSGPTGDGVAPAARPDETVPDNYYY